MRITPQQNASVAGIAAALMALCVWQIGGFIAPSDAGSLHAFTYDLFNWTLRLGWIALAIVAGLCAAGQRIGLLLDAGVSGVIGAVFLICGASWLIRDVSQGGGLNFQAALLVLFSIMFLGAAKTCWVSFAPPRSGEGSPHDSDIRQAPTPSASHSRRPTPVPVAKPAEPPVIHPASIRPASMPADGSAPSGGYLAALAREKDEPPRAAHE